MSLSRPQLSTMLHLCGRPTHQSSTKGRCLSASLIVSHTQWTVSHSTFLYLSLPHPQPQSPSSPLFTSQAGDLIQHPHRSDLIRRQLQPRPPSVGGAQLTPPPCLGLQAETADGKLLGDVNPSVCHLIFHKCILLISLIAIINFHFKATIKPQQV